MTKVSLVMCTFNAGVPACQSIESLVGQTHADWELLVQDGRSSDETVNLIQSFDDKRIKILSEPDKGIYNALNKGLARATGDIIGLLHAGDTLFDNQTLEDVACAFENTDGQIDITYGNILMTNSSGKTIRDWKTKEFRPRDLSLGWMPAHTSVFFRHNVAEKVGNFDERYSISSDYDWCIRAFKNQKLNKKKMERYIVRMPVGGASNGSVSKLLKKLREDAQIVRENRLPFWTVFLKRFRKLLQFA